LFCLGNSSVAVPSAPEVSTPAAALPPPTAAAGTTAGAASVSQAAQLQMLQALIQNLSPTARAFVQENIQKDPQLLMKLLQQQQQQ
jgi:hypothetical protein